MFWQIMHQTLDTGGFAGRIKLFMWRAKVPGGWFVYCIRAERGSMVFYPDPEHKWVLAETPESQELLRPLPNGEVDVADG